MFGIGAPEMIIVGIIAVMLFGRRLPEVGRNFGRSIMEFKKGMKDVQDEFTAASNDYDRPARVTRKADLDDEETSTAQRFVPPAEAQTAAASADHSANA